MRRCPHSLFDMLATDVKEETESTRSSSGTCDSLFGRIPLGRQSEPTKDPAATLTSRCCCVKKVIKKECAAAKDVEWDKG